MKQVTLGVSLLALGLALGVQKWEQFCEEHLGARRAVRNGNPSAAAHGQKGYQLLRRATWGNALILCYRRPAR